MGVSVERIKTGIQGFDELIEGGIPKGFNVLVVGLPGAGKTIFGLEYLYNGAINGEHGIYVSLDSTLETLKEQALQFGWDLDKLEKEGSIKLLKVPLDKLKVNLFDMIEEESKEIGAMRLVFDSLASFEVNIDQFAIPLAYMPGIASRPAEGTTVAKRDKQYRYEIMPISGEDPKGRIFYKGISEKRITYLTINELSKLGTTNFIITDALENGVHLSVDGVSEYVCDSVIRLHAVEGEELNTLNIVKMRYTNVKRGIYNFRFDKEGIVLNTLDVK